MKQLVLLTLFLTVLGAHGANILGLFYSYSKSHHIMGEVIFKALAEKGHEITMLSPFPLKKPVPRYHDVDMPELLGNPGDIEQMFLEFLENPEIFSLEGFQIFDNETKFFTEMVFNNQDFQNLVKSGRKFDVILMDLFFNDAHMVLSYLFQAPIIFCSTGGTNDLVSRIANNPQPYSYVPNKFLPMSDEMTFMERVSNTLASTFFDLYGIGINGHNEIVQKYFPGAPSIEELKENVALVFTNAHVSFETPRPFVPNVIPIGGCHVENPKPLPSDLKKYLDEATNGVIYFSLGSNVKSTYLKENTITSILTAFSKTKMKVLMKWESEELPNKPNNVEVRSWLPQNDILAHPNVKIFITHGGLMSTIESIYHGVPIIGIPIFADQISNVPQAVLGGYGLQVDFFNITEEALTRAIEEMSNNPKYTENVKQRSDLLKNQPMRPIDSAVYWMEHVIRHKGAAHMKTKAYKLNWYQLHLLDVTAFIGVILLSFLSITYFIVKKSLQFFCRKMCRKTASGGKMDKLKKQV